MENKDGSYLLLPWHTIRGIHVEKGGGAERETLIEESGNSSFLDAVGLGVGVRVGVGVNFFFFVVFCEIYGPYEYYIGF